jgi:hypothetical protein
MSVQAAVEATPWRVEVIPHPMNSGAGAYKHHQVLVSDGSKEQRWGAFLEEHFAKSAADRICKSLALLSGKRFALDEVGDVISLAIQDRLP